MLSRRRFLLGLAAAAVPTVGNADRRRDLRGKPRVVVIGGGYGGATAARYLKIADPALDVTLIHKDARYVSCPGSNEVLAGLQPDSWLLRHYVNLVGHHHITSIESEVTAIAAAKGRVTIRDGSSLPFDRAIVAPGIGFRWNAWEGYDEDASRFAPHAWQAGPQLGLLRSQLNALPVGGIVVIVAPPNPYRCPPGPYERASLIAHYLKRRNPRAKILIVDTKTQFSKQALFQKGWSDLYPGMIDWVSASEEGNVERIDGGRRTVVTEFGKHRGDVLNVIPPQQAGELAHQAGLTDASGWCPVDPITFESTLVPKIHVIGDACSAAPMPKSAFAANSQAKVCAAAVAELIRGSEPGLPSLINHCYSFLAPDYAISITGVYEYSAAEAGLIASATGETPMDADRSVEAKQARAWQRNFRKDVFG